MDIHKKIKSEKMKPEISVVICTYRRVKLLQKAIASIVNQTLGKDKFELIVVNNGVDTDITKSVRTFIKNNERFKIRLISETKTGLGYARNFGVKHAGGGYIAFLDDDAYADKNWLEACVQIIKKIKPAPVAFGGKIMPYYDCPRPLWFRDKYETREFGSRARYLKTQELFSGSNMIINKKAIENFGGFNPLMGMKGEILSVGEETSLFEKIRNYYRDADIFYYSPDLIVYHLVPAHKMSVSYQLSRSYAAGHARITGADRLLMIKRIAYMLFFTIALCLSSLSALIKFTKYRRYQNWAVESLASLFYTAGMVGGLLGIKLILKRE